MGEGHHDAELLLLRATHVFSFGLSFSPQPGGAPIPCRGVRQNVGRNLAWLFRVQQAQYNTWEACIYTVSTFYVAMSLGVGNELFAKTATFLLLVRVLYVFAYGLDLDFFRTALWLTGIYTCLMTAFAGLFPESVLPMFT